MDRTRRIFLTQSAGALGALFLNSLTPELIAQAQQHARASATGSGTHSFKFLTQQEAADFDAFAAQILPTDETPGAREAGAVYFVDYILSSINQEQQQDFRGAMALLREAAAEAQPGASSFAALAVEKQIAVMRHMEKVPDPAPGNANSSAPSATASQAAKRAEAFGNLRALVLMGTFCDPSLGGNRFKIGWKLIDFNDQAYWAPPFGYYDAHAEEKA